jgi:hypothetical protein
MCEAGAGKIDVSLKNEFGRIPFEEALQARRTEIAEFLAPLSKLEEEKLYSEIHESQIYAPEEEKKQEDDNQSQRSAMSEECMKPEDE